MSEVKKIKIQSNQLLLFGGVYSNLPALKALKAHAEKEGFSPSEIICNGDIVGYCAEPEECVQLIREWGIHNIIGNVEENLREGTDDCGCDFDEGTRCDLFSRQWYPYAKNNVSKTSIKWMKTLPKYLKFNFGEKNWTVVHGSFTNISQFIFKSTPWEEKDEQLKYSSSDGIIAGHGGLPFSEVKDGKMWLNPGVIGMPANDGNTSVWYAILRKIKDRIVVEHRTLDYNYTLTNKLMLEKQLPSSYAETLLTGIWDNCEVLPEVETKAQGLPIHPNES